MWIHVFCKTAKKECERYPLSVKLLYNFYRTSVFGSDVDSVKKLYGRWKRSAGVTIFGWKALSTNQCLAVCVSGSPVRTKIIDRLTHGFKFFLEALFSRPLVATLTRFAHCDENTKKPRRKHRNFDRLKTVGRIPQPPALYMFVFWSNCATLLMMKNNETFDRGYRTLDRVKTWFTLVM